MPAYGKNSRGGRRGSAASSSSSYISTVTMAIFVGLCLLGVYKLTSSTSTVNHPPHHHLQRNAVSSNQSPPRSVLRDPSSDALGDTQGELPEDAVKGEETSQDKVRSQSVGSGTEEDVVEAAAMVQPQERPQEEEEVETNRVSEEIKQQQDQNQEKGQINAEQQQQMSEGELGGNHEGTLQIIEQVTSGNHDGKSEEGGAKDIDNQPLSGQIPKSEEGEDNGITSQSQIDHDTDGTTENQQQQQDEQQQQPQQQEEEQQKLEEQQQQQEEEQQQQQQEQQQQEQEQQAEGENNKQVEENPNPSEAIPDGSQVAVPDESNGDKKTWEMQADQSSNEKERRNENEPLQANGGGEGEGDSGKLSDQGWELCNVTAGADYIPCLDNEKAIKQLRSFRHYEHRERHCPEESPTCLVPLPNGYKQPIEWPQSRDRIWYNNVPHTKLVQVKGHQNWVKVAGEYLTFPGGGTQFIHGALHYIDFIQESVPEIAWGKHTRVILDVGCGVASFGGYLFERDVLAMSFAPKDEHEAQVQFALERGIPAISAVMGSQRLPFPSRVFDIVHCARCRVPWHANDGALLLELNRVLRPGGYFVWSATPVYQKLKEDVEIWEAMTALTKSMCWELHTIKQDKLNSVGAAMFRKPTSNECYEKRKQQNPPMCKEDDDPNAAWYIPLQSCMHRVPVNPSERGSQWPQEWPTRVQSPPYWLNNSQIGIYGKPAPDDFTADYEHWKRVVNKSYLTGFGINWSKVRNVMDMRAVYGGFAAALRDMKVWVMNLVNIDSQDTLPIIYERGLFGMYHDWCESFSTYPRTYDLLHADHLFSQLSKRCKILPAIVEVDRIVRPGGKLIVRDDSDAVSEVENLLKSLHWEIRLTFSKNNVGILCAEKSEWRPDKFSASA